MATNDKPQAYIVVDPVSTGANVAYEIAKRGFPVICVMSGHLPPSLLHMIDPNVRIAFGGQVDHNTSMKSFDATINAIKSLPYHIIGVLAGSEPGVELTDVLADALGLPGNGTRLSAARRDKYLMGETVRAAKVRAVKQARVTTWKDVEKFVADLNPTPFKVVIKPIRSAGSDHVYLCESIQDLKSKFDTIVGLENQLGQLNEAAVVQEFLEGIEYVVDTVSRNGVHKCIAIWAYDKRSVHGVHFVYFGMNSVSGESEAGKKLIEYQFRVLDALGIKWGAGHGEVILTSSGPCLVEVGARCHGAEGTFMPLADRCWGYNQVGTFVDAMTDEKAFDKIPTVCGNEIEYGFKVDLVSSVCGKLKSFNHLDDMRKLASFMRFDALPAIGDDIKVTVDCFTAVGSVTLAHKEKAQVDADHQQVRVYEKTMFEV